MCGCEFNEQLNKLEAFWEKKQFHSQNSTTKNGFLFFVLPFALSLTAQHCKQINAFNCENVGQYINRLKTFNFWTKHPPATFYIVNYIECIRFDPIAKSDCYNLVHKKWRSVDSAERAIFLLFSHFSRFSPNQIDVHNENWKHFGCKFCRKFARRSQFRLMSAILIHFNCHLWHFCKTIPSNWFLFALIAYFSWSMAIEAIYRFLTSNSKDKWQAHKNEREKKMESR